MGTGSDGASTASAFTSEGVEVEVGVGVGVSVGLGVTVGVALGVAVGVLVGIGVAVGVTVGIGVAVGGEVIMMSAGRVAVAVGMRAADTAVGGTVGRRVGVGAGVWSVADKASHATALPANKSNRMPVSAAIHGARLRCVGVELATTD